MKIKHNYEGLEGANVYIYSGIYNIIASHDGINYIRDIDGNCDGPRWGGHPIDPNRNSNVRPRNLRNSKPNQN